MIKITKNKEPIEWTKYRTTPGVDYQSIPELIDSLLREQGYICAYCMRRIPYKDKIFKKDGINYVLTDEDHRNEHILSRVKHPGRKLDYKNMVICCPDHIGSEEHCDRLKGENDVTFNLFDDSFISTLSYKSDGGIVSSNAQYNDEINNILNLNTGILKANRKESWTSVKNELIAIKGTETWNKAILTKYIRKYSSMQQKGDKYQYIPYCGIVLYYLQKELKQFS